MSEYETLMQNRAAIRGQWMTYVDAAKAAGWTANQLWGVGVTLDSKGGLRMAGRGENGAVVLELEMRLDESEVRVTYEAPWVAELVR